MKSSSIGPLSWLLVGLLCVGCSSEWSKRPQVSDSQASAATETQQQLPFDKEADKKGLLATGTLVPTTLTVPAGTPISVRLQSAVSSATAQPADSFEAMLDAPIVVNGQTVAPRGADVLGRVTAARKSGRLHNAGYLRITLTSFEIDGRPVPLQTSSIFASGGQHKKRTIALIGGGAGAGALIGAIAGGGKGALIGSAVGAGAGTAGAYATGQKDVAFGVERRLTFRLTQPLTTRP